MNTIEITKVYIDTYKLKCAGAGEYRVPSHVLARIDPVRFKTVEDIKTDENFDFWSTQYLSCSASSTGIADWDIDSIVACEPRNCSTTPLMRFPSVQLDVPVTTGDTLTVWNDKPGPLMPLSVPIGTSIRITISLKEFQTKCEASVFGYTAEFLGIGMQSLIPFHSGMTLNCKSTYAHFAEW